MFKKNKIIRRSIALMLLTLGLSGNLSTTVYALNSNSNNISLSVDDSQTIESYKTFNGNEHSAQIINSKEKIGIEKLKIEYNGNILGTLLLETTNEKINLTGEIYKDFDDDNNYYGNLKTDSDKYEILHFAILEKEEDELLIQNPKGSESINVYLLNKEDNTINFFRIDISEYNLDELTKIKANLREVDIASKYWYTKIVEPEMYETSEDEYINPNARTQTIRSVNSYPTIKWTYNIGGAITNVELKYKINTQITQSGDEVRGQFRIWGFEGKENGIITTREPVLGLKIKDVRGSWGSENKIDSLEFVNIDGYAYTKQPPIYFNISTSKQILPGVTIGLQPNYSKSPSSLYPMTVNGYQVAFGTNNSTKYEMSKINHDLYTGIKVQGSDGGTNSYVGKNITFQIDYTMGLPVGSVTTPTYKQYRSNIFADLRTNTN